MKKMWRFRDWSLRYKLVTTSVVLVVGVTISLLCALFLNLHQLRSQALPNQRVILSLESRSYDYLSELREYVLTAEAQTLEDLREITKSMAALLDEYDLLHDKDEPEAVAGARALQQQVLALHELGLRIVEVEDRLRAALEDAEEAEQALTAGGSLDEGQVFLAFDYLSELREYVLDPDAETLHEIAELHQAMVSLPSEELLPELSRLFTAGHLAVSLRQELSEVLENIEDEERSLGADLNEASSLAARNVARATRQVVVLVATTSVLGLALAGLVAVWLARRIARPIEQLRDAAQRFAGGEFETRAPIESNDELGQLCGSFNQMAEDIERLVKELQESLDTLRQSQVQLIQSGKMIAVGELAASVAHELNNPLSVVLTYTMLMQEECADQDGAGQNGNSQDGAGQNGNSQNGNRQDGEPQGLDEAPALPPSFPEWLGLVKASAERCKTIIDGLLQFSRQDNAEYGVVDLADVLARTFELVGSQMRRHQVRWHLELAPTSPPVRANANQLQQVFTNLALNAMQAMPSGGELKVRLPAPGSEGAEAGFCEVLFIDTGVGIPPDQLERVFEPFFTTKASGQGTGLGLAIVYGIIQRHGGRIAVESSVGEGTVFRIHLPLANTETTSP